MKRYHFDLIDVRDKLQLDESDGINFDTLADAARSAVATLAAIAKDEFGGNLETQRLSFLIRNGAVPILRIDLKATIAAIE